MVSASTRRNLQPARASASFAASQYEYSISCFVSTKGYGCFGTNASLTDSIRRRTDYVECRDRRRDIQNRARESMIFADREPKEQSCAFLSTTRRSSISTICGLQILQR